MKPFVTRAVFLALAVLTYQSSAFAGLRCEDLFSENLDQAPERSTFFAPQNTTQRVLRQRILNEHFLKKGRRASARAAVAAAAAPAVLVEEKAPQRDWTPTPTVRESATERVLAKLGYHSFKIFPERAIIAQWVSNNAVVVTGPAQKYDQVSRRQPRFLANRSEAHLAALVDVSSGKVRELNIFKSDGVSYEAPFMIAEEAGPAGNSFTYRFIDKATLEEIREPLVDVNDLEIHGRFMTYEDNKRGHVLSSLLPEDFGVAGAQPVVRSLPKVMVDRVSNDGSIVVLNNHMRSSGYDPILQAYGPNPVVWPTQVLKDEVGNEYDVMTIGDYTWQIYDKKGSMFHLVEVDPADRAKAPNKGYGRVLHIYGQGASRSVIVETFGSAKGPAIGVFRITLDDKIVTTKKATQYDSAVNIADRMLMLLRNKATTTDTVSFLDLQSGQMRNIGWFDPANTILSRTLPFDETRYFLVRRRGSVDEASVITYKGSSVGKTHYLNGIVELVRGTRVIRLWGLNEIKFLDMLSGEVLWTGATKSLPTVSPDGSRVAYVEDGVLRVDVLGKSLETRLTF